MNEPNWYDQRPCGGIITCLQSEINSDLFCRLYWSDRTSYYFFQIISSLFTPIQGYQVFFKAVSSPNK